MPGRKRRGRTAAQQGAIDGSTVIRLIQALYLEGTLGKIFGAALTGSWFTIALNCASLILMVVGLFTTGGAYLAVVLAQLVLNIAVLIAVIAQKPSNCHGPLAKVCIRLSVSTNAYCPAFFLSRAAQADTASRKMTERSTLR